VKGVEIRAPGRVLLTMQNAEDLPKRGRTVYHKEREREKEGCADLVGVPDQQSLSYWFERRAFVCLCDVASTTMVNPKTPIDHTWG
jgi:hypothetical protein